MTTTKHSPSEPVTAAAAEKTVESIATLYAQGVERLAEVQHQSIDLAVKQNAELVDAWKKIAQEVPGTAGLGLLAQASSAFERYAEGQKAVLEQGQLLAGLFTERITAAAKTTEAAAATVHQTVAQVVAVQKQVLDYTVARTRVAFETARQFGLAGTQAQTAANSFQHGMGSFLEYQKALLNIAAKPFGAVN